LQLTHTINVVEVVWTSFCALGLYFNVRLFWRATIDLATLRQLRINHIREHAAVTHVLSFAGMTFVQFALLVVGLYTLTATDQARTNRSGYAIAAILILVNFVLVLLGWIQESRRRRLIQMIADIEEM